MSSAVRVVLQDLCLTGTGGEQRENIGDTHPSATDSRATVDHFRVDGDALQQGHGLRLPKTQGAHPLIRSTVQGLALLGSGALRRCLALSGQNRLFAAVRGEVVRKFKGDPDGSDREP